MVRTASSLSGPWAPGGEVTISHPDSFPGKSWTTNPAPWFDGEDVWYPYRNPAGYWPKASGGSERLGIAKGSKYDGPFNDLTPSAPIVDYDIEDPYFWKDARGNFHMLTHKKDKSVPSPERDGSLGHFFSSDGIAWSASANSPVSEIIALQDGTSVSVKKMARPQLFVRGGVPQYISIGSAADEPGDHTLTVVLPLRSSERAVFV